MYIFDYRKPSKKEYLYGLNKCFPEWGGDARFDHIFDNLRGPIDTNFIGIRVEGTKELVAGSGVTYRTMIIDGARCVVGIMTASWTLPHHRGKGLFSEIISASLQLVRDASGAYLLAFVQSDNASSYQLGKAGARMMSMSYVFSKTLADTQKASNYSVERLSNNCENAQAVFNKFRQCQMARECYFDYSFELWRQQFCVQGPAVSLCCIGNNFVILQETKDLVKVLFESISDNQVAIRSFSLISSAIWKCFQKPSMFFQAGNIGKNSYSEKEFVSQAGFLAALPAAESPAPFTRSIYLSNGDRL